MSRAGVWAALCLILAGPARAQYAADDFALTQCGGGESLFRSGIEAAEMADRRPSGGGGSGDPAGDVELQVEVPDTARVHAVRLRLPPGYDDAQAWPLVVTLHGAAGSSAQAPVAAGSIRSLWTEVGDLEGMVLLAPIASGQLGGWVPALDTPALACAIAAVERRYNIDRARRFLWGFSAGGHYAHSLALGNARRFAAHAVKAGALLALACDAGGGANDCSLTLPAVTRRVPVLLRVGDSDPLRPQVSADLGRFTGAGWSAGSEVSYVEIGGGHSVIVADTYAAWSWFEPRPWVP